MSIEVMNSIKNWTWIIKSDYLVFLFYFISEHKYSLCFEINFIPTPKL